MKYLCLTGVCIAWLAFASYAAAAPPQAGAATPQRVLFLYSFGRNFEPWDTFGEYLRTDLTKQAPRPIDLYEVSLETSRFGGSEQDAPFVGYLQALFLDRQPDLVVAIGGPAVHFLAGNGKSLFPTAKLLYAGADERMLQGFAPSRNSTSVLASIEPASLIRNILQVLPDTKTIAVVIGNSPLEKYWLQTMHEEFKPFEDRIEFVYFNEYSSDEMRERASRLPKHSAILYADVEVDAYGVPHDQERVLAALNAITTAPIFGLYDYQLGGGIVGGPLLSIRDLSRETASIGARILSGEEPGSIKTAPQAFATPEFDARELQRWGIRQVDLPPGSIVRFIEPTLWDRYKWWIALVTSLFVAEVLIIAVLLINRNRLRRAHARLSASERHMSLAASAANLRFWVWDIRRDEVWSTEAALAVSGSSLAVPIKFDQFVEGTYPEDRESVRTAVRRAMENDGEYRAEYRVLLDDSTTRWVSGRGRAEFDHTGRARQLRAVSIDITERRRAEEEAYKLGGQLINAQEEERARLARALHDDVTQRLALLALDAAREEDGLTDKTGREALSSMRKNLVNISRDVHDLSYALHPAILEDLGLVEALRAECERFAGLSSILVNLSTPEVPWEASQSTALCLFRIAQEALRNVTLHSRAKGVDVSLKTFEEGLELCVRDDGVGFDASGRREKPSLGHASMRQRVNLLNGRLHISSRVGLGTTILAWVPRAEARRA